LKLIGLDWEFQNHPNLQQRTRNSHAADRKEFRVKVRSVIFAGESPGTSDNLSCSHVVKLGV